MRGPARPPCWRERRPAGVSDAQHAEYERTVHAMLDALEAPSDDTTIDDWLYHELVDFASTVADRMERAVRGFRCAYFFPGKD